jgi:hypothetical protein
LTKKPKAHDGEKIASSTNGLGKMDIHMKNEIKSLSLTHIKINSKWSKDLNIRPETLKQLQEVVGNTPK